MKLFEMKDRIDYFHALIKRESTGSACEFAEKLHLKKSQLHNIINEFRDYGADIQYDKIRRTYFYSNNFNIKVEIHIQK